MVGKKVSAAEPYATGRRITYTGRALDQIAFPLGGIGTDFKGVSKIRISLRKRVVVGG